MERGEPTTYQEAIVDPNSEKWVEAMKAEMQSMYDNQVCVGKSQRERSGKLKKNLIKSLNMLTL